MRGPAAGRFPPRLPPPPPGLPRRLRAWYAVAAALAAAVAAVGPRCRPADPAALPAWRVDLVHDGDTVTCLDEQGRACRIRLAGIDAPELDQPHGAAARTALAGKLAGGIVGVDGAARDQHRRLLATLRLGDRDLNRELVAEGHAWAYGGFASDEALVAAETEARRARRGLWAQPDPLEPSRWRALHPPHQGAGRPPAYQDP